MCDMEISEGLQLYAEKAYAEEITSVLMVLDWRKHYTIAVDTMSLFAANETFAHQLFEFPLKALKFLNDSFYKAALNILKKRKISEAMDTQLNIHARLIALPNLPEIYRLVFPNCSDVGQFMCLCGTVIRATASKMLEYRKLWRCNKCKYLFTIDAEVDQGYISEKPTNCPNPEWCNGKNFTLLSRDVDPNYCKDYQEIKIQEQAYNLTIGSVPRSMWIILEDDLVDICQPGNDVAVSGVLIQRWKPLARGKLIDIDLVLLAHNVEVKNKTTPDIVSENLVQEFGQFWLENQSNPLKGRDFILTSICPQVFGLYIVKLAVALIMAGGVEKKDENSRIRGDSHLLLVGDPGTGKSQFLKFASKVSMRSVLTSGIGTTNAGLTVSAVKEGGKWQLEAGALVLADGGICCIDEFSCIKEHDKTCIHEAMEQQTISVAKAGLVCSLSTRCSILAVTNPKGKYDENLSLSENTALASPLLSRFDIILVLLDTHDEKWDEMVSTYILAGSNMLERKLHKSMWPVTKMRNYFSLIRYIKPKVTHACERVLQAYYKRQRSLEARNYARTTPRLLQSLIRLAEGHAKLMFRYEVLIVDAIIAIILMESSMSGSSILSGLNILHTSFPDDPKAEYQKTAETVLRFLNLENLLEDCFDYEMAYADFNTKRLLSEILDAFNLRRDFCIFDDTVNNSKNQPNMQMSDIMNDCTRAENIHSQLHISKNEESLNKGSSDVGCTAEYQIPKNRLGLNINNEAQCRQETEGQIPNQISKQRTHVEECESSVAKPHILENMSLHSQVNIMDLIADIQPEISSEIEVQREPQYPKEKLTKENNDYSKNKVSTLSDLNNTFSSDLFHIDDAMTSFEKIFKKKPTPLKQKLPIKSMLNEDNQHVGPPGELNIGISRTNLINTEKFSGTNENNKPETFNPKSYEFRKNSEEKKYKFSGCVNNNSEVPMLFLDKKESISTENLDNGSSNVKREFLNAVSNKKVKTHISVKQNEPKSDQKCISEAPSSVEWSAKLKSKLEKYQIKPKITEVNKAEKSLPGPSKSDIHNKTETNVKDGLFRKNTKTVISDTISDDYQPLNKKCKTSDEAIGSHILTEQLENQNDKPNPQNSSFLLNTTQHPSCSVDNSSVDKNKTSKQLSITQSSQAVFKRIFSSTVNVTGIPDINLDEFDIDNIFET